MARLSALQRAALQAVADGRVAYGDPYPDVLRRRWERAQGSTISAGPGRDERVPAPARMAAYAVCTFLVDGLEVYGQEKRTYSSLGERELIEDWPNPDGTARVVTLTTAGRQALAR